MIAVLSAVLIVTLAAASTYAYIYLPVGSVQVTTLSQAISDKPIEISVITPQEGSAPGTSPLIAPSRDNAQTGPSITAQSLRTALTEEGTRAASGTRQQPRGKATGTMRFANRTGNVVNVPIGTQFKGANGVTVQTTQGGSVPPTAFINQSVGTLELPVAATVEGPDGNIASGQVAGTWKGLLDYTNTALQGGTMETVKVIKQEDIDVLAAELRAKAEGEAASAVVGLVGPGQTLITPTISLTNAQFTVLDHKAGDDGESVRVRFTAEAGGYAYEESQMHDSINQAMLDSVQTSIPLTVGPSLDMASVTSGPPVIASTDQGRVVYRTRANGRVTFALTPELASRIRILIKGKRISEASNLILQNYGSYLNPDSIEAKVLWFNLNTLPNDPGRIIVQPTKGRP
jgi:hypothetical protein